MLAMCRASSVSFSLPVSRTPRRVGCTRGWASKASAISACSSANRRNTGGRGVPVIIRQMRLDDVSTVAELTSQLGYPATDADIKRRYDFIKDRWDARLL